ncbi:exodeoxyribonuclease VIII, partial [Escherichia coli]|nr:exodeoxyribonuclease VIII [Escherichia coli]EIZ3923396.1 exodeoxyribonuclease VIII [Escherichia coli]
MQAANTSQPDANQLLAVSRGEFVAGISDPNDPKWVKGIETRDSVNQNQQESEQNDQKAEQNSQNALQNEPETKQSEPVAQQEPEKVCTACGQSGGGNCPDCGTVMGDATYQETFNEENQVEVQENDPKEMEGAEHPHKENAGSDPHRDCSDETGEAAASSLEKLDWKRQVVIAAVYGLCANPAGIASAPLIPGIAMMIANKLENFGVTDDEHMPDF